VKTKLLSLLVAILIALMLPFAVPAAEPATILHVVTVKWRADSTPQQQQAAIEGVRKMAADVKGIRNIWIKKVKVQPSDFDMVFAMEFENKAAFEAYTTSEAHKAWEAIYLPIREESRTQDITN
jgi:hypothetical protein